VSKDRNNAGVFANDLYSFIIMMPFNRKRIAILVPLLLAIAFGQAKGDYSFNREDSDLYEKEQDQQQDSTSFQQFENADYMNRTEQEVIMEINRLRSDPAGYARTHLAPLRTYYHDKMLILPGKKPMMTREGIAALEECIQELENTRPTPTLSPCEGLTLASRDLADDQGPTETTGHIGNDGSSMPARIERHGEWAGSIAENISYGFSDASDIVITLLIDDGVPSRGHRQTLLNGVFNYAGVTIGPHRRYHTMCVIDFATAYATKQI
jgi:uncharacterized protein YkwD